MARNFYQLTPLLRTWAALILLVNGSFSHGQIELLNQLDVWPGNDRYSDVWAEGDYAYVGSFEGSGVAIFDISTPASAAHVATYDMGEHTFQDVKVVDGVGYFADDRGGGLHIVDLAEPTSPVLRKQFTSADGGYDDIHNVSLAGGFLYQADDATSVVKVLDVSDPFAPLFVRDIVARDLRVHDVTAIGNRLYTSGIGGRTDIYDVTNVGVEEPTLLGSFISGSYTHSSWADDHGETLVVSHEEYNGSVQIYDIGDPENPVLRSTITRDTLGIDASSPHNPILVDDLLFISWYEAGLQLLDISDPDNPALLGSFDTFAADNVGDFDGNWGVYPFLGPERVLLSDLDGGLFIVDVTGALAAPNDCNGDGLFDAADIDCACAAGVDISEVLATADLLQGDADLDGHVQFSDFVILADSFGHEAGYGLGDFDCDGRVDFPDFVILANNFGETAAVTTAAPEPAGWLMALVAAMVLGVSRRL